MGQVARSQDSISRALAAEQAIRNLRVKVGAPIPDYVPPIRSAVFDRTGLYDRWPGGPPGTLFTVPFMSSDANTAGPLPVTVDDSTHIFTLPGPVRPGAGVTMWGVSRVLDVQTLAVDIPASRCINFSCPLPLVDSNAFTSQMSTPVGIFAAEFFVTDYCVIPSQGGSQFRVNVGSCDALTLDSLLLPGQFGGLEVIAFVSLGDFAGIPSSSVFLT